MDRLTPGEGCSLQPQANTAARELVASVLERYPEELRVLYSLEMRRNAWLLDLTRSIVKPGGLVVDVGGAVSPYAPSCAAAGYSAILIDEQLDNTPTEEADVKRRALDEVIRPLGVKTMERDVLAQGVGLPEESADLFTGFDFLEHLHHSPKAALHEMVRALRPGGSLLIGTPNCVNLRKRVTALFGRAKWTQMEDWYERPVFRGHVREPDVDDLRYIARDLGLSEVRIFGRNWAGYRHPRRSIRVVTSVIDRALRLRPALCSDIYFLATKH